MGNQLDDARILLALGSRAIDDGLRPREDLKPLISDPYTRARLIAYVQAGCPDHSIVYNAETVRRLLGFPAEESEGLAPHPKRANEIVLYYGGWTLKDLRSSPAGKQDMRQDQKWYDKNDWVAKPGYYRLLLPAPGTNYMSRTEQLGSVRSISKRSANK
tara:strand:- start:730 stop:1206 length:477 start_codon:yes stop_codon:yes gene_type:complete